MKITIDGYNREGKTLTAMRIAAILEKEGYDVAVITEKIHDDVLNYYLETPADEICDKKFNIIIQDTNNNKYNKEIHQIINVVKK